ncbi:Crp/Fnr family transcriptional regulator [Kallotenue papyrolyticum]|uniref:Crp/Fnr family transcriptional regulator n=1 Tax=Kallotenue papyrolyticum TaxID=1325125 RepID=UPI0004785968|nr:Crp/Fnr family transcriptional regulator [Kallotenue papyrolyticum]
MERRAALPASRTPAAIPLFGDLDEAARTALARAMHARRYRAGQFLIYEGTPAEGLFVVCEGRVRLSRTAPDGREQVLTIIGAGEVFNMEPLLDGGLTPFTARAMSPVSCLLLPGDALVPLIRAHPDLALVLMRQMAEQLREQTLLIEDLGFRSVRARLARLLLQEAASGTAMLTQAELAARAGTVREIVGRTLRQMAAERLVELKRGRVIVLDADGLRRAAEI